MKLAFLGLHFHIGDPALPGTPFWCNVEYHRQRTGWVDTTVLIRVEYNDGTRIEDTRRHFDEPKGCRCPKGWRAISGIGRKRQDTLNMLSFNKKPENV